MRIFTFLLLFLGSMQAADLGPAIGSRIPAFSAPDQHGAIQTLDTIKGPKGAMLVFYRSADW